MNPELSKMISEIPNDILDIIYMFGQMVITEFVITYSCTNTDENSDDIPSFVGVKEVAMHPKELIVFKRFVNK